MPFCLISGTLRFWSWYCSHTVYSIWISPSGVPSAFFWAITQKVCVCIWFCWFLWHRNVGTLLLLNWYFKIYVVVNLWSGTTDPRASWSFSSLISGSDCNYSINLVSSTWLKPKQVSHGSGDFVPDYSPVVCIYLVVITIVISILHGFLIFS